MQSDRFRYYHNSQMIIDDLTGEHFSGNKKCCDKLNELNKKADENAELYMNLKYDIQEILIRNHMKFRE